MELDVFSHHEQALKFRAMRNQVLTANIANADTPNYKARDYDFREVLASARDGSLALSNTNERHLSTGLDSMYGTTASELKYRIPFQSTLDGNTVETDVEQAAFAENALQYRASLRFLDGSIRTLKYALRGGE